MQNTLATRLICRILSSEMMASIPTAIAAAYWREAKAHLHQQGENETIASVEQGHLERLSDTQRDTLKAALAEVMIQQGWPIDRQKVANGRLLKNCIRPSAPPGSLSDPNMPQTPAITPDQLLAELEGSCQMLSDVAQTWSVPEEVLLCLIPHANIELCTTCGWWFHTDELDIVDDEHACEDCAGGD